MGQHQGHGQGQGQAQVDIVIEVELDALLAPPSDDEARVLPSVHEFVERARVPLAIHFVRGSASSDDGGFRMSQALRGDLEVDKTAILVRSAILETGLVRPWHHEFPGAGV